MNFLQDYLAEVIPVDFDLRTDQGVTHIGGQQPRFTVTLNGELSKRALLNSTSLALGEAYMQGTLEVDHDLYEVLDSSLSHMERFRTNPHSLRRVLGTSLSKRHQRQEVSSHYDIGNDFYQLWLDETMSYSCGYFLHDDDSLYQAQVNKVEHILQKLQLKPGMTLLDIGCGWGFLLQYAARHYGVKGLGITLSQEQQRKFQADITANHLEDTLSVRLMDYRDLAQSGLQFDRVVSVGMLEHVGRGNYGLFLQSVDAVLKPQGLFLLHYISALEEHPGDAWIKKYIFPGGVIPSLREIIALLPEHRFYTLDVESLRRHYNRTLLCWRTNFLSVRQQVAAKYGEEFTRMWDLYLAACAATFHNGIIDLHQILVSKGVNNELPMTRIV